MSSYQHLRESLGLNERQGLDSDEISDIGNRAQSVEQDAGLLRQANNEKKARSLTSRVLKGMVFVVNRLAGEKAAKQLEWIADQVRKS